MNTKRQFLLTQLLLLICISSAVAGNTDKPTWFKSILSNPGPAFASSYEKVIFQTFLKKFTGARIAGIEPLDQHYQLSFDLPDNYALILEVNEDNKIKSIYRPISEIDEQMASKWLGKLFYRLDAGDSASLNDFLFSEKISFLYQEAKSRSQLIRELIENNPGIMRPRFVQYQKNETFYTIHFATSQLGDCSIRVPGHIISREPTDDLQRMLLNRIDASLQEKTEPANSSQVYKSLKKRYPGWQQLNNVIEVPYLENKVRSLPAIHYLVAGEGINQILPRIELANNRNTLLFNKVLTIPFYGDNIPKDRFSELHDFMSAMYQWCIAPGANIQGLYQKENDVTFAYHGYKPRRYNSISTAHFRALSATLAEEGGFYLYPSRITLKEHVFEVNLLLFIVNDLQASRYHFAELNARLFDQHIDLRINFYPYSQGETGLKSK